MKKDKKTNNGQQNIYVENYRSSYTNCTKNWGWTTDKCLDF